MSVELQFVDGPLDDRARGARLFAGAILVFRRLAALERLRVYSDRLIRRAFAGLEPERAQYALPREAFLAHVKELTATHRDDPEVRRLLAAALCEAGVDPARTYWDVHHLRLVPSGRGWTTRRTRRFPPHRDSWGSNILCQVNWWTPLYPVDEGRTIAFYPRYWEQAVANGSAEWDFHEMRRARAVARAEGCSPDEAYPLLPLAREPVPEEEALPVVVAPGDLLCFSGAQLHGTVPNETGLTRFSVEVRTVCAEDLAAGRGAPDLDSRAPRTAYGWFSRIADGAALKPPAARCPPRAGAE